MELHVSFKHIRNCNPEYSEKCAITLCLKNAGLHNVDANYYNIKYSREKDGDTKTLKVSKKLMKWQKGFFDKGSARSFMLKLNEKKGRAKFSRFVSKGKCESNYGGAS